jgi:hypothetical protein
MDYDPIAKLLKCVEERGLSIHLNQDGQPCLRGPKAAVTPKLIEALKKLREPIIERLLGTQPNTGDCSEARIFIRRPGQQPHLAWTRKTPLFSDLSEQLKKFQQEGVKKEWISIEVRNPGKMWEFLERDAWADLME